MPGSQLKQRASASFLTQIFFFVLTLAATLAAAAAPPPPARADRFGVYHWGADYSAWPGAPDRVNWGAGKVAALGSRTLRVFFGASDFYGVNPDLDRDDDFLRRLAQSPAYRTLFADPRFRTYLLTVYPPGDFAVWKDGFDAEEARHTREQIARLGAALLAAPAHAGKTFILLNWEGDHGTGSLAAGDPGWAAFSAWVQARADGVRDARARVPAAAGRLFSGLEFNLVEKWIEDESGGRSVRCGEGAARCVLDMVAPRVTVDYYAYSAWQSLGIKSAAPGASLERRLRQDLGFALATIQARRPEVRMSDFILGEVGFARSLYGECAAAAYLREALAAAEALGVSYTVVWQALDNRWRVADGAPRNLTSCREPDWLLYGLFDGLDGGRTLLGAAFSNFLAGRRAAPPPASCPRVAARGVLDPARRTQRLRPGGPVAVLGAGFSPAGNRLHVLQAHDPDDDEDAPNEEVTVRLDAGGAGWSESAQRIRAALPQGSLHEGCAFVYVTNAEGIDSNAVLVRVRASRSAPPPPPPNH